MNIALFTDYYLPSVGGAQTSMHNQMQALRAAGHTVVLFAPTYAGQKPWVVDDDGVVRLPGVTFLRFDQHRPVLPLWWYRRRVQKMLRDMQIDVVHIQSEFTVASLGVAAARQAGIPVAYTCHTLLWQQIHSLHRMPLFWTLFTLAGATLYWRSRIHLVDRLTDESFCQRVWRSLVVDLALRADGVCSPSQHLADKLIAWGVPSSLVIVRPNIVPDMPARIAPLPATFRAVWLARLSPEKRPEVCIEAGQLLAERGIEAHIDMYGGYGIDQAAIAAQAIDCDAITLHPAVPYPEVPAVIDAASVLLVTSYGFENQPMIIAEALSRGRGVVYCDPVTSEGLQDGAGYVTRDASAAACADALQDLAVHPKDVVAMSKAAAVSRDLFCAEQYVDTIIEFYGALGNRTV